MQFDKDKLYNTVRKEITDKIVVERLKHDLSDEMGEILPKSFYNLIEEKYSAIRDMIRTEKDDETHFE